MGSSAAAALRGGLFAFAHRAQSSRLVRWCVLVDSVIELGAVWNGDALVALTAGDGECDVCTTWSKVM